MDTARCPSLLSTDLILTTEDLDIGNSCSAEILVWIFFMVGNVLLSTWIAFTRTKLHLKRENRRAAPLIVILSWASTLIVFLFLILPFFGLNALNGGTLVLFVLECVTFNLKGIFLLRKLVALGRKIIPLSSKFMAFEEKSMAVANLSRINGLLLVSLTACWITSAGQLVCLLIIQFALPVSQRSISVRTVWGLEGSVVLLICGSLVYQLQRCIVCIRPINTVGLNANQISKLKRTISRMQRQQLIVVLLSLPGVILYILLAAGVIPLHYSTVLVVIGLDVLGNLLMVRTQNSKPHDARRDPDSGVIATSSAANLQVADTKPNHSSVGTNQEIK
jgi:hypothetical protein